MDTKFILMMKINWGNRMKIVVQNNFINTNVFGNVQSQDAQSPFLVKRKESFP